MIKNKKSYFAYYLGIGIVSILGICFAIFFHFDMLLTWFPISIAILAIILTSIITIKQHMQILDLNKINKSVLGLTGQQSEQLKELNKITKQLKIEKDTTSKVQCIFPVRNSEEEYFHCYFPVQYLNSPLPVIFEGDYFALQVLKDYLKDKLKHNAVLSEEDYVNDKKVVDGNIIFICTPWVNSALRAKYPPYQDNQEPNFSDENYLPCWFVEKVDSNSNDKEKVIRIFNNEMNNVIDIPSLAEPIYNEYQQVLKKGQPEINEFFKRTSNRTIQDFGIFARRSTNSGKHTIIAGIHQYGTWILGEYVKKLLTEETGDENPFLSRSEDFVAIIYGEFHPLGLYVENASIYTNWIWFKEGGKWIRYS